MVNVQAHHPRFAVPSEALEKPVMLQSEKLCLRAVVRSVATLARVLHLLCAWG